MEALMIDTADQRVELDAPGVADAAALRELDMIDLAAVGGGTANVAFL